MKPERKMDNKKGERKSSRKAHTIPDDVLETTMVSSELSERQECQKSITGYIKLTQANDKPIFINTKYIVLAEPAKIARYHYTEGSLISLSVGGSEGLQTIKVIEPGEVVIKAIEQSYLKYTL